MKDTAFARLLQFLGGEVFDSFAVDSSKLPFEKGEDILEHVKRVKTDHFQALIAAARRELEMLDQVGEFAELCAKIEEKKDPDSIMSLSGVVAVIANEVERPFITSGTIGDDVHKEPCFFIGSRDAVAKFRTTEKTPAFQ